MNTEEKPLREIITDWQSEAWKQTPAPDFKSGDHPHRQVAPVNGVSAPEFAPRGVRLPAYDHIPPEHMALILAMGQRASGMMVSDSIEHPEWRIVAPSPPFCAAEIASAHLLVGLDLAALAVSDDLTFRAEYLLIARHLDRKAMTLPREYGGRFVVGTERIKLTEQSTLDKRRARH